MRIGLVIPVHNRPEYFAKCLQSIKLMDQPREYQVELVIVNDGSTDPLIEPMLKQAPELETDRMKVTVLDCQIREGVCGALINGLDWIIGQNDLLINLDSDALVRNDFISRIVEHHEIHPDHIITGFHSTTKNKDGTERHKILEMPTGYLNECFKESVGGINMAFRRQVYTKYVRPILEKCRNGGNWDHQVSIAMRKAGTPIICITPSIVQHIGFVSSMGHGTGEEKPDTADDFRPLALPSVTLIGIDCLNFDRLASAAKACTNVIAFADVKLLTSQPTEHPAAIQIPHIGSIEKYSDFLIKDLYRYIDTEHVLVIQYDGYVLNYKAWSSDFLEYDYIGAPWWYKDGRNVGNGGFSLRSKKLMEIVAKDPEIKKTHPEDHVIGRTYRRTLELKHGIKFAPEEVAEQFSIEGWNGNKHYTGQFGFHGHAVNKSHVIEHQTTGQPEPFIISQFQGIGDILFSMPLIRSWIAEGHKIVWPVITPYVGLNKHFPEVTFIDQGSVLIDYNRKQEYQVNGSRVIPLRWAEQILRLPYKDVMKAKYLLYGQDWRDWHKLDWIRDPETEDRLMIALGIETGEPYNLINKKFRSNQTGHVDIKVNNGARNIEVRPIAGFTMLDWAKVVENAAEIHTVSTGILYMIDRLETKGELHQYLRKPDEKDYSFTDYLWTKEYRYHL